MTYEYLYNHFLDFFPSDPHLNYYSSRYTLVIFYASRFFFFFVYPAKYELHHKIINTHS